MEAAVSGDPTALTEMGRRQPERRRQGLAVVEVAGGGGAAADRLAELLAIRAKLDGAIEALQATQGDDGAAGPVPDAGPGLAGHPLLLRAADIARMEAEVKRHNINPRGVRYSRPLGDLVGLLNSGIHLVAICPGDETTEYHRHHFEEEWVYILSGKGSTLIDEVEYIVEAGDFLGFPAGPGEPCHTMHNPASNTDDLVYLLGGDRKEFDVVRFH